MFYKVPVRKIEFDKNIKLHYNKFVNLVLEYALIATDVKLCVYNSEKGPK